MPTWKIESRVCYLSSFSLCLAKINAREAARTSPIKATTKHDSSSGRKGTNIFFSLLELCFCLCFAKKDPLLVIDSSRWWWQEQDESGVTEWHPVCVVCSRKFELMHVVFSDSPLGIPFSSKRVKIHKKHNFVSTMRYLLGKDLFALVHSHNHTFDYYSLARSANLICSSFFQAISRAHHSILSSIHSYMAHIFWLDHHLNDYTIECAWLTII